MAGCYAVFHKQLGDLLLLEPALTRLSEHHDAPVSVLTRQGHAPLLALMPGVEFQKGLPLAPRGHLYCFDPLSKSAFRSLLTPAAHKAGILPEKREMRWYHPLLFHPLLVPGLGDRYVAEYFWETTPVSAKSPFRPPRLSQPPAAWQPLMVAAEKFVLLNPTSGWRKKCWEAGRWIEVIKALRAERGFRFILTSASTDWQVEHSREIAAGVGEAVQSLASGTTLEQFLWLCSHAQMILTVDGAASHLGAAFGVKNLTLFGPTSIQNWHYPSERSRAVQAPPSKDGICRLRDLPVDCVLQAARDLFAL